MSRCDSGKRPTEGIAVDASYLSSVDRTDYQGVDIATGERLFMHELGRNRTINQGEFLAIVHACQFIIENDFRPRTVYSDSMVAIKWFKDKRTASSKSNPAIKKAEIFLKALDDDIQGIEVKYWDNDAWGETPADFGRKANVHKIPDSAI